MRAAALAVTALAPAPATAHSFGQVTTLPVPYWLYLWGATASLALSFVVVAWFMTTANVAGGRRLHPFGDNRALDWLRRLRIPSIARALTLALFLLCVCTGLWGSRDPYRNFNMTFIWVVFMLGFGYLTALVGNLYALLSPWRSLSELLARVWGGLRDGRMRYPAWLAWWPALTLYFCLIALELFAHVRPAGVAWALIVYSCIQLAGCWLFGARDWLRHGELFAVYFGLIARIAPIAYDPDATGPARWRLRWPGAGLLEARCPHLSLLLFLLFMLSSTAFDGLRETAFWFALFWKDPSGLVTALAGQPPLHAYVRLRSWYLGYELCWLALSPLLYLGLYALAVAAGRALVRSERPLSLLLLDFAYPLLPIALVYNITHYATLVLAQGVKIVALASDPFGRGWNLFGTALTMRAPILPDLTAVWHAQVLLIVLGHVASVVVAHMLALRLFGDRKRATLNQLPMLALMMLFTAAGLWILAQPLQN